MPLDTMLFEQAEMEGWSDEKLASKTDFDIERIP